MRASPYYDRTFDLMGELVRMTVLLPPHSGAPTGRYSEWKKEAAKFAARTRLTSI